MRRGRVLYDLSLPIGPGTPEWPGDRPFDCGWTLRQEDGGSVNLAWIAMSPHVGTHADAPLHVLADGEPSDRFPLDVFRGRAHVVELPDRLRAAASPTAAGIGIADLAGLIPEGAERVLLRTGATIRDGTFPAAWPSLTAECVGALCERGLRLLGVDAPSVDPREDRELGAHKALFGAGAYNLENLDLAGVPAGEYELVAYPLRLAGLDAAPVRAVLLGLDD